MTHATLARVVAHDDTAWLTLTGPPLDVAAITARARAAPDGPWTAFTDRVQVPWFDAGDDTSYGMWDAGRYLAVQAGEWHTGSEDPPPALWEFLAAARGDVLALAAEVWRLRAVVVACGGEKPGQWRPARAPQPSAIAGTQDAPRMSAATHVLTWLARYETRCRGCWDISPMTGWDHLDRPDPWPVPDLPRDADSYQVEAWAYGVLGYRVRAHQSRRLAVSLWRPGAGMQPFWVLTPVAGPCDGTAVGVIATDSQGRYLLTPADRPGPLVVVAPPRAHAAGRPWDEAALAALAGAGAAASEVCEGASAWQGDRCHRVPAPFGTGHNWVLYTARHATRQAPGTHWVTREELQRLAGVTVGYATGRIPATELAGEALAPEWVTWLAGSVIGPLTRSEIAAVGHLARA